MDDDDVEDGGRDADADDDKAGGRGGGARPDPSADDGREARDGGRANANCAATLGGGGGDEEGELAPEMTCGRGSNDAAEGGTLETAATDDKVPFAVAPTNRKSSSRCCGADAEIGNICSSRGSAPVPHFFLAACEKLATNSWICARRKSRCSDDSVSSPEEGKEDEDGNLEAVDIDADDTDATLTRAVAVSSARRATAHSFSVTRSRYSSRMALSDSSSA
jgi:hypothetical protein